MEFLSPTRFETPPYVRRPAPVYDVTPSPRNILKSALKTAERLGPWGPAESRRFYRWAYAAVGIIDYRVRLVTTSLGGGWRARGFVGWAVYRAFETSMLGEMWRALSAAADFGLGANRPLGFSAVRITPLEDRPNG